jgi:hypothetical protein
LSGESGSLTRQSTRDCRTCDGYGSVSGFWLGSRKKCPACDGRGHQLVVDSRLSDALAQRDHWKNVARRLLADMDAVRRTIAQFEDGLPPCEDWQTTVSADGLQMLGQARVLCEVALQDHAGVTVDVVEVGWR